MNILPARQELHQKIIHRALQSCAASEHPQFIAILGGPGAGKTALTNYLRQQNLLPESFVHIHMNLFSVLPEFPALLFRFVHPEKSPELVDEYHFLVTCIIQEALLRRMSIVLDEHGDNFAFFQSHLSSLYPLGYTSTAFGMVISPQTYITSQIEKMEKDLDLNRKIQRIDNYLLHLKFCTNWQDISLLFHHASLFLRITKIDPIQLLCGFRTINGVYESIGDLAGIELANFIFSQWSSPTSYSDFLSQLNLAEGSSFNG